MSHIFLKSAVIVPGRVESADPLEAAHLPSDLTLTMDNPANPFEIRVKFAGKTCVLHLYALKAAIEQMDCLKHQNLTLEGTAKREEAERRQAVEV